MYLTIIYVSKFSQSKIHNPFLLFCCLYASHGRTDGQTDGWTDGRTGGPADRPTDRRTADLNRDISTATHQVRSTNQSAVLTCRLTGRGWTFPWGTLGETSQVLAVDPSGNPWCSQSSPSTSLRTTDNSGSHCTNGRIGPTWDSPQLRHFYWLESADHRQLQP